MSFGRCPTKHGCFKIAGGSWVGGLLFMPNLYATSCFVVHILRVRFPSESSLFFNAVVRFS
jgi:hypothetical protein